MSDLRTTIGEFTDEQLRTAYFREKDHYTAEALTIMCEELSKRGLPVVSDGSQNTEVTPVHLDSDDFVRFDYSFSHTDFLLATVVLRDNNVPFFVDNPSSTGILPFENESEKRYTIRIHKTFIAKTHELLDEHFIKADNKYLFKYTGARDRLKAFNFHDIHPTDDASAEELDVDFADDEKRLLRRWETACCRKRSRLKRIRSGYSFTTTQSNRSFPGYRSPAALRSHETIS